MAPLEELFALEVEFHHRLRCDAPGVTEANAMHTSYVLQSGYEPLLRNVGRVTIQEIERIAGCFTLADDARDVLAVRDSMMNLLGLYPFKV
jgi:hypothetical protein